MQNNVEAMQNINPHKQLYIFNRIINHYRYMWSGRSELLAPLSELTSNKVEFKWNYKHQKIFDVVKSIIGGEVLLAY